MKKKIINGLLFAVAMVAATSSFVSCKDYDADNYNELQAKYASLQDAFNKQVAAMQDYVLTSRYNAETGYSAAELAAKGTIKKRLDDLENDTASLAKRISDNNLAIKKAQALAERDSARLHKLVAAWGNDLDYAIGKAAEVLATVANDSTKWNEAYDSIAKRSKEWNRAVEVADKAWAFVDNTTTKDGKKIESLQDLVDAYEGADEALKEDIAALKQEVANVLKLIQQQVTGIEIQATKNPLFGSFAYPVDVQSNILALYYNKLENPVRFPAGDQGAEASTWALAPAVLTSELDAIGAPRIMLKAGEVAMLKEEGNAGVIYLTVNPSDVVMDGKEFTLRASDNSVSKVALSPLETCTEQLKWGYNRAASANGFYTAKATINENDVDDVALSFDIKSIASDIQGLMQDWSKNSAADIAKLAMAIRDGFKADVPRLGVQAQWKDTLGWKNYVSKYDVAAFSAKPLGYEFLKDADFSPAIVKFHNKIIAKEKAFEMELINEIAQMIVVNIPWPNVVTTVPTVDGVYTIQEADGKMHVHIKATANFSGATSGKWVTIPTGAIHTNTGATDPIPNIPSATDNAQIWIPAISVSGTAPVDLDITEVYATIKNSIENTINGLNNNISTTVDKYVQKIINAENKIFGKVESVAKNLNRYVQPALIGKCDQFKGYFYPSRLYTSPTEVKKGTKIMFYPTSLTGEVVVPAFKKYVAITGAWETTGDYSNITKELNAKDYNVGTLNTIFDGKAYNLDNGFDFTVPDVKTGTVLEFTYECLGYNGLVAGKKFYIAVYE